MATAGSLCNRHAATQNNNNRPAASVRGYNRAWKAVRDQIIERDPICRICQQRQSVIVHHIIPKAAGGPDTPDNLIGVCRECHPDDRRRRLQK